MCTGKCSRLVGLVLVASALACMAANILLFFPNAEEKWTPDHITTQAWLMGGIIGGGTPPSWPLSPPQVLCTGCSSVRAGGKGCCGYGCCGNRCRVGGGWSGSLGVRGAPVTLSPWWGHRADRPPAGSWVIGAEASYLQNQTMWELCMNPPSIVLWHIVLFSILLGLSLLEMVLCAIQVVNGLLGTVCGDCRKDQDRAVSGQPRRRLGGQGGGRGLVAPGGGGQEAASMGAKAHIAC
uniref:Transmembrane 4 L six family member 5 n=1 Tax=Naja naja TaxID=35670 RepID=A0A8C6Y7U6_NAJNA